MESWQRIVVIRAGGHCAEAEAVDLKLATLKRKVVAERRGEIRLEVRAVALAQHEYATRRIWIDSLYGIAEYVIPRLREDAILV